MWVLQVADPLAARLQPVALRHATQQDFFMQSWQHDHGLDHDNDDRSHSQVHNAPVSSSEAHNAAGATASITAISGTLSEGRRRSHTTHSADHPRRHAGGVSAVATLQSSRVSTTPNRSTQRTMRPSLTAQHANGRVQPAANARTTEARHHASTLQSTRTSVTHYQTQSQPAARRSSSRESITQIHEPNTGQSVPANVTAAAAAGNPEHVVSNDGASTDWDLLLSQACQRGETECAVCLTALVRTKDTQAQGVAVLTCSHVFHVTCIAAFEAFEVARGGCPTCPLCRAAYSRRCFAAEGLDGVTS